MNANELRIGNWIYDAECKMQLQIGTGLHLHRLHPDSKPIPITEEWLVNFGFDRSSVRGDKHFYKQVADRFLRLSIGDFWNVHIGQAEIKYYEIPVNIKYIHQLQNIYFFLTGEELTIKKR